MAFKHALIVLVYSLVALGVAVLLPGVAPVLAPPTGWFAGALVLVAGIVLHESYARSVREGEMLDRLVLYAQAYERLQSEVFQTQAEVAECRRALATTSDQGSEIEHVASEVRILQDLVARLSTHAKVPVGAEATMGMSLSEPPAPPTIADLRESEILDAVREALRRNQVDLYLQPIVSLPQRKVRHYECFSRVRAGDDSVILPEQFLGLIAREGLIGAIDNLLLFRCVQLVRRAQKRRHNVGFFCNISAHTLADRTFFADFSEFIAANPELASQLHFELNQNDVVNRWNDVAPFLMRLARLGFTFSLDQVSNFDLDVGELTRRHFRFVKLDVAALLVRARQDAGSVQALKRALDQAGIDLIVEKIEEESDLIEALDFQIDYGQGYLFGEPQKSREA
ncbi:MAG TPA: EAL domain-containing protein [Alphaproteobacteria bacterium]|nr:EAL domain-containing protein [Alphaproteobacteria bacterium]